jgi:outer membrane receptor protein involved in Fe transport
MKKRQGIWFITLLTVVSGAALFGQTTGKISGKVLDAANGEPLVGANVLVEGTTFGAVADVDGSFYIINIQPGAYDIRVQYMGYASKIVTGLKVSVNRTTEQVVKLNQTMLEGKAVVVEADKISIKKDQTSSIRNVSSEEMSALPVQSADGVVAMQAGVVGGHFRGGRTGEVSYMIDGMQVDNAFSQDRGRSVDVDKDAIEDMEVITGTFNAEYGNAMSGVVNYVTKTGSNKFHGRAEGYFGNYFTGHDNFIGLKSGELDRDKDFRGDLEGPIWKDKITFYANYSYEKNKGPFNGIRRFNPWDLSDFTNWPDGAWFSENTGDDQYVPMAWGINKKFNGKLAYNSGGTRLSFLYIWNEDQGQGTNGMYVWKYNPDGRATGYHTGKWYTVQLNQMISKKMFVEAKVSYLDNFGGYYMYKNPTQLGTPENGYSGYFSDRFLAGTTNTGFYTGGQDKSHGLDYTKRLDAKLDATWQVSRHHSLKAGVLFTNHEFNHISRTIKNLYEGTPFANELYEPVVYPDTTIYSDVYVKKPREISAYLQDKMEFEEMTVNLGLRFETLDPATVYPSNWRNPTNSSKFPDESKMSRFMNAPAITQVSPRVGLGYQLGQTATLHFAYGHFFQAPAFQNMYQDDNFLINVTDYATTIGNANVKAQRSVCYEVGLWQALSNSMNVDVVVFYKDIYDLSTVNIYSTYNNHKFGVYGNKDYGNARGLEIKYNGQFGNVLAMVNYTLQYTRGNADNPTFTFSRAGTSSDPIPVMIPMSWDQRHTLNVSLGYNTRSYGATMTAYYQSGFPYTWSPLSESTVSRVNLYPNNATKPTTFSIDLYAFYDILKIKGMSLRAILRVYNLTDRMNEYGVDGTTGRANQRIIRGSELRTQRSDFNDYFDRFKDPSAYSYPRLIKFGMALVF